MVEGRHHTLGSPILQQWKAWRKMGGGVGQEWGRRGRGRGRGRGVGWEQDWGSLVSGESVLSHIKDSALPCTFHIDYLLVRWLHGWEQENWLHSHWLLPTSVNQTVNCVIEWMCRGCYVTTMCSAGLSNCAINCQCIFKPWTSNLAPLARLPPPPLVFGKVR